MAKNDYIMEKNHMEIPWHDYTENDSEVLIQQAGLIEKASVVGRVGLIMLSCGTGAWRVRTSMNRLSKELGVTCTVDVGLMSIEFNCFDGKECVSQSLSIANTGVNTSKLYRMEQFVNSFPSQEAHLTGEEIHKRLDEIEKIHAAGLLPEGVTLCVTDTQASHSELTGEFAAIRQEMEAVAACLGGKVLGQVPETDFWAALPRLRTACGDRAVLRAIHYYEENARTLAQRRALLEKRFADFAALVLESGRASFALCQNVYCATDVRHQGLSVALALSQSILQGSSGAWRMQGGGFAGTIQAYVPETLLQHYHTAMERVFGPGSCYVLRLREQGARQVL